VINFVSDLRTGRWFSPSPPDSSTNKAETGDVNIPDIEANIFKDMLKLVFVCLMVFDVTFNNISVI
jgi:hypothetical protein